MLRDLLDIRNGDVVSVVGSGGKTSFVYQLSKELCDKRVLVSTTTKMFIPLENDFDFVVLDNDNIRNVAKGSQRGTYFIADRCDDNLNKVKSLPIDMLSELTRDFDVTILESDGAKRKLVKAWADFEPVIIDDTTKTIGIINLSMLYKEINEENIHRLQKFKKLTAGVEVGTLSIEHYFKIVTGEYGLFSKAKGEKILFINGVEAEETLKEAIVLIDKIKNSHFGVDKIIYGSLINGCYLSLV